MSFTLVVSGNVSVRVSCGEQWVRCGLDWCVALYGLGNA